MAPPQKKMLVIKIIIKKYVSFYVKVCKNTPMVLRKKGQTAFCCVVSNASTTVYTEVCNFFFEERIFY